MPPRTGWWRPIVWAAAVALGVVALGLFGRVDPAPSPDEPAVEAPAGVSVTPGVAPAAPAIAAITIDIARTLARQGDLEGSERAYREAIAQEPDSSAAHAGLGRVLLALGRPRAAS